MSEIRGGVIRGSSLREKWVWTDQDLGFDPPLPTDSVRFCRVGTDLPAALHLRQISGLLHGVRIYTWFPVASDGAMACGTDDVRWDEGNFECDVGVSWFLYRTQSIETSRVILIDDI